MLPDCWRLTPLRQARPAKPPSGEYRVGYFAEPPVLGRQGADLGGSGAFCAAVAIKNGQADIGLPVHDPSTPARRYCALRKSVGQEKGKKELLLTEKNLEFVV
jgi:hypothetical protein